MSPQCGPKQVVGVEIDELRDQAAVGRVRGGADHCEDAAHSFGQFVRPQGQAGDDAEGAAATTLQRPEQIGIDAGVGDAHRAVSGDDLGLQKARGGGAVLSRKAAVAAALHQPGNADGQAAAALDVAAVAGRHLVVDVHPDRTRANRYGR